MRVGVTGHQTMAPEVKAWVEGRLRSLVAQWPPSMAGVSSLAKGADQLFAHAVLAAGLALEAVLPCREYAVVFDVADREEFASLLARSTTVVTLDYGPRSEDAYLAAGWYVASHIDRLAAVWYGHKAQGRGGTGDIVEFARSIRVPVTVVWPQGAGRHG